MRNTSAILLLFLIAGMSHGPSQSDPFSKSPMAEPAWNFQDTVKVVLEQTSFTDMSILYITDTAATTDALGHVLGKGYGELMKFINDNKLQSLKFMAWYYSSNPPWPIDIAVQTDRMIKNTSGRVKTRTQKGGEVLIAHMWGPYEQAGEAYKKIQIWLKENNRVPQGSPFEVYINDPSAVRSPSEIRTDIYQPLQSPAVQ